MPISTKPRVDTKLHCNQCGKKRNVKLGIPVPNEDKTIGIAMLKIKNLLTMSNKGTLPNQKEVAFPKKGLVGTCPVCFTTTFYDINKTGKVVAQKI